MARLKGAEGGPAAAAALKDALDKSQRELSVLQAEYSRVGVAWSRLWPGGHWCSARERSYLRLA